MVPKPKSPTWKKVYKIIRIARAHFKAKHGIKSLRKSPTRNNVLNYSAATRVFQPNAAQTAYAYFFFGVAATFYSSSISLDSKVTLEVTGRQTGVRSPLRTWMSIFVTTLRPDPLTTSCW